MLLRTPSAKNRGQDRSGHRGCGVRTGSVSATSLMGFLDANEREPGLGGDHNVGHVVVADATRFDDRDVGRLMKTLPSASWGFECTRFIELPVSPLVRLFSLPRPGRLSPSSSNTSVLNVGGDEPCAYVVRGGAKVAPRGRADPRRARCRPVRGSDGFSPVRIGRVGPSRRRSGDFRPRRRS